MNVSELVVMGLVNMTVCFGKIKKWNWLKGNVLASFSDKTYYLSISHVSLVAFMGDFKGPVHTKIKNTYFSSYLLCYLSI